MDPKPHPARPTPTHPKAFIPLPHTRRGTALAARPSLSRVEVEEVRLAHDLVAQLARGQVRGVGRGLQQQHSVKLQDLVVGGWGGRGAGVDGCAKQWAAGGRAGVWRLRRVWTGVVWAERCAGG